MSWYSFIPKLFHALLYYEDKIDGTTWNAVQNTRSGEDGRFELTGYIPGYYVVRYTYGDKGENLWQM